MDRRARTRATHILLIQRSGAWEESLYARPSPAGRRALPPLPPLPRRVMRPEERAAPRVHPTAPRVAAGPGGAGPDRGSHRTVSRQPRAACRKHQPRWAAARLMARLLPLGRGALDRPVRRVGNLRGKGPSLCVREERGSKIGLAKVHLSEIRLAEVRLELWVLLSPLIPHLHPLLENFEMLWVCHLSYLIPSNSCAFA
jgi:hypothetical protein